MNVSDHTHLTLVSLVMIPKSETQQGSGEKMPLKKMEAVDSGEEVAIFTLDSEDSANFG